MNGRLSKCPACPAFLPPGVDRCPACASQLPRWVVRAAAALGSGALAVTLSACYGAPCAGGGCYEPQYPVACDDPSQDLDGDGYCGEADCDERDANVQACPAR
ncbi:MAG: hypothetical protein KC619_19205 [Myxococcales bacterium]|nr:hypothetical protein [Myxococcales bacterium]